MGILHALRIVTGKALYSFVHDAMILFSQVSISDKLMDFSMLRTSPMGCIGFWPVQGRPDITGAMSCSHGHFVTISDNKVMNKGFTSG
jgi:hypothetical protein